LKSISPDPAYPRFITGGNTKAVSLFRVPVSWRSDRCHVTGCGSVALVMAAASLSLFGWPPRLLHCEGLNDA